MNDQSPSTRAVFTLAWPMAMNAMLLQAILVIDTMLVSPLGEEALAAMGLASGLVGIGLGVLFAFSNGTQLLAAQAEGASDSRALGRAFWSGLLINLVLAGLCAVVIISIGQTTLEALSQTPTMAELAWRYIMWFALALIGVAICQNITVSLYATGMSRLPFYGNLLELPVNAMLSYALIYGKWGLPELGLSGAAIGSAAAVGIRAAFLIGVLALIRPTFLTFPWRSVAAFFNAVRHHFAHALPIAGTFISATLSMQVCMLIYAQLPIYQFALLTLLTPWMKAVSHAGTAWGQGTGIVVGQLLGRQANDALDEFVGRAWRFAFYIAVMNAVFYALMCVGLRWVYPALEPQTLALLPALIPFLIILPLIRTSNVMCGNVLRAGGDAAYSLKVHMSVQWLVTVPLSALFILIWGLPLIWVFVLMILDEIIKAFPFHRRIYSGRWKRRLIVDA